MAELKFHGIREWVRMAKERPGHAPKSWEPFDRWLDKVETRVRDLEESEAGMNQMRRDLADAELKAERFEGLEADLLDVGRGIKSLREVVDEYGLDPEGIFHANSGEIALR